MAISLDLFFDFDLIVFFALPIGAVGVGFLASVCAMKFNAQRTASVRPTGVASRFKSVQELGAAVGVNCDVLSMGPWRRWKAVSSMEI